MKNKSEKLNIFLITFVFFPFWFELTDKNNLIIKEILFFYVIVFLIFFLIFRFLEKNRYYKTEIFISSSIIILGLDINFGFWIFFKELFNHNILNYFSSFIFLILSTFCVIYIVNQQQKNKVIFVAILVSIVIFNFSTSVFYNSNNENIFKIKDNLNTKNTKKKLIIFLDEMMGPAAIDKNIKFGKIAINSYIKTFKKNGFILYDKAYGIYPNTVESIPHTLNFSYEKKNNTLNLSGENFRNKDSKWYVKKNILFDQNRNILTNRSLGLDLCNHKNVSKCVNLKAPKLGSDFIEGFHVTKKNFIFDKLIKSNSIILKYIYRIFYEINFFDEKSDFSYQKAYFEKNLDNISQLILNTNYELFVFHLVVPHRPLGFKLKDNFMCGFDNQKAKIQFTKDKYQMSEYYEELICTNIFLESFFKKLKDFSVYDELEIVILSDTGLVTTFENKIVDYLSGYSTLFAVKKNKPNKNFTNQTFSNQYLFSKYLDKNFKEDESVEIKNFIYDPSKRIFLDFSNIIQLNKFNF